MCQKSTQIEKSSSTVLDNKAETKNDKLGLSLAILQVSLWSLMTYASKEFSIILPTFQSKAGADTFIHAGYQYVEGKTFFDNSILTWGTDFILAVIFIYAATKCFNATHSPQPSNISNLDKASKRLRHRSALLFTLYAISVFTGGIAHYTFTTLEGLNSMFFRICWMICVGAVSFAGGVIGMCGSEINRVITHKNMTRFQVWLISDFLWFIYGGYMTTTTMFGEISYSRPACDIFVAGVSQFLPTTYCILVLFSFRWKNPTSSLERDLSKTPTTLNTMRRKDIIQFIVGLLLNAPLLPSYPLFIQYTNLSLGVVNAILHCNLLLAWGIQSLSLHHFCLSFNAVQTKDRWNSTDSKMKKN